MAKPLFEMSEKFGRSGLWFTILAVFGVVLYSFLQLLAMGVSPVIMAALVPGLTLFFFLVIFFRRFTLYVRVDQRGIEFQFLPMQKEIQVVEWKFVSHIDLVDLSTAMQFVGWGLRHEEKRVYNINGKQALELTFSNGKKLLIGTKKASELYRAARDGRRKSKRFHNES